MEDEELRRLAEELAERVTSNILMLENVTLQEGGCEHTSDDDDGTCWHCREERYERVVLSAAPPFLRRVAEEARRQERLELGELVPDEMGAFSIGWLARVHELDFAVRNDGREYLFQGDWLKPLLRRIKGER